MVLGPHVFPFTPSTGSETDANIIIYIISGFHFIFLESDENDDIEKDNENNRNAAPEKPNNQKPNSVIDLCQCPIKGTLSYRRLAIPLWLPGKRTAVICTNFRKSIP